MMGVGDTCRPSVLEVAVPGRLGSRPGWSSDPGTRSTRLTGGDDGDMVADNREDHPRDM